MTGPVTRLDALRALLSTPRDHVDQGRIGTRVIHATADGREKLSLVFKVMRFTTRKAS